MAEVQAGGRFQPHLEMMSCRLSLYSDSWDCGSLRQCWMKVVRCFLRVLCSFTLSLCLFAAHIIYTLAFSGELSMYSSCLVSLSLTSFFFYLCFSLSICALCCPFFILLILHPSSHLVKYLSRLPFSVSPSLSLMLLIYQSIYLSIDLSVYLSICLSVSLSLYLSVYISILVLLRELALSAWLISSLCTPACLYQSIFQVNLSSGPFSSIPHLSLHSRLQPTSLSLFSFSSFNSLSLSPSLFVLLSVAWCTLSKAILLT